MKQTVLMLVMVMGSSLYAQTATENRGSATTNTAIPGNVNTTTHDDDASTSNANNHEPQGVTLSPAASQQDQSNASSDVAELLAPRPLPPNPRLSLIGGTVTSLDLVRNRMVVRVFGGKKLRVDFDERSHIYRDGVETTSLGIRKGDRVYLDTMLYGSQVFARNVHVEALAAQADVEGSLESVDAGRNIFTVRDKLTEQSMSLSFSPATTIENQGHSGTAADLQSGALVRVHYASLGSGRAAASNVSVLAAPGNAYVFYGEISHIDKRLNMIAIRSATGDRFYDISVEGGGVPENLRIGATARVTARFDGKKYVAQNIAIEQPAAAASETNETETPAQQNPR